MALHYNYIKKIITVKGQEMYYSGDGCWFGRISKVEALEGLQSGKYRLWSVVNKATGEELTDVKLDANGQIIEVAPTVETTETELPEIIIDGTICKGHKVEEIATCEIVNSECEEIIGKSFPTIEKLEKFINDTIQQSKTYWSNKIWLKVLLPDGENTFSFRVDASSGNDVNLKAHTMQSLKSSIQCCKHSKEDYSIYEQLLTVCESFWGVSKPSDCYSYHSLVNV